MAADNSVPLKSGDSSVPLKSAAATVASTGGSPESGSSRTMRALEVHLPTAEAETTTSWLSKTATSWLSRPRWVQTFSVLVALALVAAGAILDMKAAQKESLEIVMTAVRQDGLALEWAGVEFKDNKAVVLAAVQQSGNAVKFASDPLKRDREVALRAARHSQGKVLEHVSKYFPEPDGLEVQLTAVRHNPRELNHHAPLVKQKKTAVLDVVRVRGDRLRHVDDSLKKDKDVVLEALRQNGGELETVHKVDPKSPLLEDPQVVLEAVRQYGPSLQWAHETLKDNEEVVLAAVRQAGRALQYASDRLKKDHAVVMAAVVNQGFALKFAVGTAKTNAETAAVFQDFGAVEAVSKEFLQAGRWKDAVGFWHHGSTAKDVLMHVKLVNDECKDAELQRKVEVAAVRFNGMCLGELKNLQNDKKVVETAVRSKGLALEHAAPVLKRDSEVVLAAVRQNGLALKFSELKELKDDKAKAVVLAAVQQNGRALEHAGSFSKDPEVVLAAVREYGLALQFADAALRSDRDVVLAAVRHDRPIPSKVKGEHDDGEYHGRALQYAGEKLQKDRDVVFEALRSNGRALEFVKVNDMTATWKRTIIAFVLVLCIVFVVPVVFTPPEASANTASPSERV